MKITKVNTTAGQFRTPVSTELSTVIECMQGAKTKEAADRIASISMQSRLMMEQGMPKYHIRDTDQLPYLIFSATFGKAGFDKPLSFTGLVLLSIPCPQGIQQVSEMRERVRQIPYTMLAFAGVSGVTLKVVVRCEYDSEDLDVQEYTTFLKEAKDNAMRLYMALAQCDMMVGEVRITNGCRMSYDPQLYYNPQAQVLPVVRQGKDPLKAYEGTKTDDNGTVVWYPGYEQRERIELEYQTCLSKALDDCPENMEQCLQTLADYCNMACLAEEGCVVRTSWNARFKPLGIDLIRKTFRNAYIA